MLTLSTARSCQDLSTTLFSHSNCKIVYNGHLYDAGRFHLKQCSTFCILFHSPLHQTECRYTFHHEILWIGGFCKCDTFSLAVFSRRGCHSENAISDSSCAVFQINHPPALHSLQVSHDFQRHRCVCVYLPACDAPSHIHWPMTRPNRSV